MKKTREHRPGPPFPNPNSGVTTSVDLEECLPGRVMRTSKGIEARKNTCSPSYVDIRSRANTTRGLNFDHMIK
jgi:hypothetical protein